jgi:hypothetical protein
LAETDGILGLMAGAGASGAEAPLEIRLVG